MIDFTKLTVPTAEELKEMEERRRERTIAEDMGRRRERSRKSVIITLECDAECRFTMQGSQLIALHGTQTDRKPVHAVWYAPDHMDREEFTKLYNRCLLEGCVLGLDGYWKPFKSSAGETRFTFIAQFIQFQDGQCVP
jgi:hypothetical protein